MNRSLFWIFLIAISCLVFSQEIPFVEETNLTVDVNYYCAMQDDGYFNISGIIDGQIKTLVTLECLKSGENNSTITLEKSDHYVYYVQWKRVGTINCGNQVFTITDSYGVDILKFTISSESYYSTMFTLYNFVKFDSQILFSDTVESEDWYKRDYHPGSWDLVYQGNETTGTITTFYYRYEFESSFFMKSTAFTFLLKYLGTIYLYINDQLVFLNSNHDVSLPTVKVVLPAYMLQERNLIAIFVNGTELETPPLYHINMQTYYHYNSFSDDCSYTMPVHTYSSTAKINHIYHIADGSFSTYILTDNSDRTQITMDFEENTYYMFNRYLLFPEKDQEKSFLSSYILEGSSDPISVPSEDRTWTVIDEAFDDGFHNYNKSVYLYAFHFPFSSLRLTMLTPYSSETFAVAEFYPLTCTHAPQAFAYSEENTVVIPYKIPVSISPLYYGYFNITLSPALPEGLHFDSLTGVISGSTTQITEGIDIVAIASLPYHSYTTFKLVVSVCSTSHLLIVREYGRYKPITEGFDLINKETKQYAFREVPWLYNSTTSQRYEICIDNADYDLNMYVDGSRGTWRDDSFVTIYMIFDSINYNITDHSSFNLLYKGHQDTYSEFRQLAISTKFVFPIYSQYKYKWVQESSFPEGWYTNDYDDSDWETYTVQTDVIQQKFYLFRIPFTVPYVSQSSYYDLYIRYSSGIKVYINGQDYFSNNYIEPFSMTARVFSYSKLLFRRITVPGSLLQKGQNVIAIVLLPDTESIQEYSFAVVLHDKGPYESSAITTHPPDADYAPLFDFDYRTGYIITNEHPITFNSTTDEYTILTQYAFSIFTSTNLLPSTWLLEGRQNPQGNPLEDDEGWVTLDRKESYTTRDTNSRTVFFVVKENRHLCNEYRFVYIYANYENQIHISELELYTFDYPSEMPPFEYKKPYVNAILNTYIDRCTINNAEYYYNFTSDPSLPDGFSLDPMNGYITGMVSAESDINEYTISAIGVDGKTYSTKMYFTFLRCSTSNTLFSITTNFNNLYRDVYFSINDPNQSIPIYSTLTLEDLYPRRHDPTLDEELSITRSFCIPRTTYEFTVKNKDTPSLAFPYSYTFFNEDQTYIYSHSLKNQTDTDSGVIHLEGILTPHITTWKFRPYFLYDLSFLDYTYDLSLWGTMFDTQVSGNNSPYIYFRTYFNLTSLSSHSSLDLSILASGSIEVYINHVLALKKNYNDTDVHENRITYKTQGNMIKSTFNIIGVVLMSEQLFKDATLSISMLYKEGLCTRFIPQYSYSTETPLAPDHPLDSLFDFRFDTFTKFESSKPVIDIAFEDYNIIYFNTLLYQVYEDHFPSMISVYGKEEPEDGWTTLIRYEPLLPSPISDNYVTIEKGLIHFKYLRIEFEAGEDDSVILSELSFAYCNYETEICPIDDGYPSVGEYMYSYKTCGYGYSGYKTRFCDGFKFGEENRDNCIERPPKNLHYSENQMNITSYTPFTSIYPIYDNIINYYRISKPLENYLYFNTTSGMISGTYVGLTDSQESYEIEGINSQGTVKTSITINYVKGTCPEKDGFPETTAFDVATISCESGKFGRKTRVCSLDEDKHIAWDETIDECTPLWPILTVCILTIVIFVLVIIVAASLHINKKNKETIHRLQQPRKILKDDLHSSRRVSGSI